MQDGRNEAGHFLTGRKCNYLFWDHFPKSNQKCIYLRDTFCDPCTSMEAAPYVLFGSEDLGDCGTWVDERGVKRWGCRRIANT